MKITTTKKAINVKAGATALAKMGTGFLARTSLACWLAGSLGCFNLLFATAVMLALKNGVNTITYGVITFTLDHASGNGFASVSVWNASALDCFGNIQTASVKVTLDHNKGKTAKKAQVYRPATKTENDFRINYIDGWLINFTGAGFDVQ